MLDSLSVHAQATGRAVPMLQVAAPRLVWEPSTVRRRNRIRTATYRVVRRGTRRDAGRGRGAASPWLDAQQRGGRLASTTKFGGEEERSVEANNRSSRSCRSPGWFITVLLVGQFNSIRSAVIVLLTIPLGLIGVVAGLVIAQSYFGFMTLLGIVGLAGIVINNAIVIIDRIRDGVQLRAGERGRGDASAGLFPAGDAGVAAAAREGRQAARRAGPSPAEAAGDAYLVAAVSRTRRHHCSRAWIGRAG